ncbi:MAG: hypothetical protein KAU03_04295, partial [Candidatus Altiarchaeales archaeon]|nr:hypothetical protein [Candidatus Altiarchaeales archaeon]
GKEGKDLGGKLEGRALTAGAYATYGLDLSEAPASRVYPPIDAYSKLYVGLDKGFQSASTQSGRIGREIEDLDTALNNLNYLLSHPEESAKGDIAYFKNKFNEEILNSIKSMENILHNTPKGVYLSDPPLHGGARGDTPAEWAPGSYSLRDRIFHRIDREGKTEYVNVKEYHLQTEGNDLKLRLYSFSSEPAPKNLGELGFSVEIERNGKTKFLSREEIENLSEELSRYTLPSQYIKNSPLLEILETESTELDQEIKAELEKTLKDYMSGAIDEMGEYKEITDFLSTERIYQHYKQLYGFPQYGIEPTSEKLDELLTDEEKKIPKVREFFRELHKRMGYIIPQDGGTGASYWVEDVGRLDAKEGIERPPRTIKEGLRRVGIEPTGELINKVQGLVREIKEFAGIGKIEVTDEKVIEIAVKRLEIEKRWQELVGEDVELKIPGQYTNLLAIEHPDDYPEILNKAKEIKENTEYEGIEYDEAIYALIYHPENWGEKVKELLALKPKPKGAMKKPEPIITDKGELRKICKGILKPIRKYPNRPVYMLLFEAMKSLIVQKGKFTQDDLKATGLPPSYLLYIPEKLFKVTRDRRKKVYEIPPDSSFVEIVSESLKEIEDEFSPKDTPTHVLLTALI